MGIDLFGDCNPNINESDLFKIEIDKEFAKRFEHNKKREALHRLEELKKRGLAGESEDSEDSSDESSEDDADRPVASGKKDLQFYDALVRVKKKDPAMQQKDAKLFSSSSDDEEEEEKRPKDLKKKKPLYLKDLMARQLMEEGPEFDGEPLKENPFVYNREQAEGIKALLEAEKEAFDANGDDDIIKLKEKNSTEDEDENAGEIKKRLDEYFGEDENLSEGDMFLKNYLINRMWVDKEKDKRPSLDEIRVSEDEDELDRQDKYEAEYNFRHEEGQEDRVLGHSRIVEGSVRKKSNSRKEQRKSKGARLIQSEFERREELKHLKNLKKKEIQEKLDRIRETAGMGEDAFYNVDIGHLEEEFDPEEYDKTMRELFGAEYYNAEDVDPGFVSETGGDLEKPDFNKEDKLLGLPKDWDSVDTMEGFETLRKVMLGENDEEKEPLNEEGKRKKKRKISLRKN
ncbi:hypothetical protein HPP92_010624 [Vanilla planifolia]|uniref:Kri1-like C-terminal domain-containing protein n=1 Tax=Vanilla planifolia TaxID=51239 RepID=A0A835QZE4_VANPL|nr:hypothetical protein HPP92_010851 [Vanilla planifolia]KAG0482540.1 hypothetical protein HPP92_010624 [Vanilla planifolia]